MLEIRKLNFKKEDFILKNIDLYLKKNEYFVLLGPTGSSKTTLMKCIAGIYRPSSGKIIKMNRDITGLPPEDRNMGYLPQNYALFPHLNVEENINYGLKIRRAHINNRIKEQYIRLLNLESLLKRKTTYLSGGEQQRVALARALVINPDILLLDEPFSSIDEGFKRNLWLEMKSILKQLKIPVIHITHNLNEASVMGERVGIMLDGEIRRTGNMDSILRAPESPGIARFLGYKNIFQGEIVRKNKDMIEIRAENFSIHQRAGRTAVRDKQVQFCIREEDIKIIKENYPIRKELKNNLFTGKIIDVIFFTNFTTILFKIKRSKAVFDLQVTFPSYIYKRHGLYKGKTIRIALWEPKIILF
ncbi:MAG: ABC transporter ATP-binding protein [Spirochaetes bacterium]|nr:ABC transporter ATP-binding protein [Spirochaetota bacterium]